MHGSTKHLRLSFDDDFDDYPESINGRKLQVTSTASIPAPQPFRKMTRRSTRARRQQLRRMAAAAAARTAVGIVGEVAEVVAEENGTAPVRLPYGKDDPIGFKTIEDGYIPLEKFPLFPKLPLEMRREVWRRVLPEPQSIFISSNGYTQQITVGNFTKSTWVYRAEVSYKVPLLLAVCRETRQEVMLFHVPAFAAQFSGVPIYYNPKIDLLHFSSPETLIHFYGGSVPNFHPRCFTNGFRLNMRQFHTVVPQIAIGKVQSCEGVVGGVLNQMKGLKVVMLENQLIRSEGEETIREYCRGSRQLELGWEEYTIVHTDEDEVKFKLVGSLEFKQKILGWTGRILSEEEEAAMIAAKKEARALEVVALSQQQQQQANAPNAPVPTTETATEVN